MSAVIEAAVAALKQKMPDGFDGVAKFVFAGEGAIMVDQEGVRAADEPADVTLTADTEVFRAMLDGDLSPTTAYMTGKLAIDGSLGLAMQLGAAMS